ncbi:heavy metal transport/detoxification protein [Pleurocapsales cyanobacterium LEGE 10410]|nr:heavy metal transport/detoxification protein [Pleurocapsales cyanobacterium LEGE 10410]
MQFNVPTIDSSESAEKLKETILTSEPSAKVEIDSDSKTVTINSKASTETFKQLIVAAGHKLK